MLSGKVIANLALVLPLFSSAVPTSAPHVQHEKRDFVPSEWEYKTRANGDAILPVRVGLTQSNLDRGHDMLMDLSSHDSPNYGKHWSAEQVHDFFAPSKASVDAVRAWLEEAGIAGHRISQSANKQWMQLDASVGELEDLVKTKYHVYQHESGGLHTACDEYHVPQDVQAHIDYITPGIKLHHPSSVKRSAPAKDGLEKRNDYKLPPLLKDLPVSLPTVQTQQAGGDLATCDSVITPQCIKAMYNITQGNKAASGNKMGIFEDLGDHYSQEDLNKFFASVYSKFPQGTHPELRGIDGATGSVAVQYAGGESNLDFMTAYPIIHPQQTVLFQTDDNPTENNYTYAGFLNNFLDAIDGSYCTYSAFGITGNSPYDPPYPDPKKGGYKGQLQCGVYKPTNVISISYGGQEPSLPVNYQKRQCNEFMKLGMQGVSVFVASGDSGVAARTQNPKVNNGCIGKEMRIFNPDFPATCPYISVLGGTFLDAGSDVRKDQERAVTRFPSGGGFSNIYPAPSYQTKAVNAFLNQHPPPYNSYRTTNSQRIGPGRFNAAGRGYPDFAAVGDNVLIYLMGSPRLIGGTSASTPVFAAIINRINEERIAAGKSTVGFVNPTLYAHPGVFHDITVGSNPGCGTDGFQCQPGWDPVTGLGTPNYPKLLNLFMGLP